MPLPGVTAAHLSPVGFGIQTQQGMAVRRRGLCWDIIPYWEGAAEADHEVLCWVMDIPSPSLVAMAVPPHTVELSRALCATGMDFHKELHRIEAKEGLRGRKLQKALESFAWNITVLKVRGARCASVPSTAGSPAGVQGSETSIEEMLQKCGLVAVHDNPEPSTSLCCMAWPCTGGGTEGLSNVAAFPDVFSPRQGQADLLKHAKAEALDNLWQIHNAGQSCGIGRNGLASPEPSRLRAPLEPIPEAEGGSDAASC